jgi:hypothetical protein
MSTLSLDLFAENFSSRFMLNAFCTWMHFVCVLDGVKHLIKASFGLCNYTNRGLMCLPCMYVCMYVRTYVCMYICTYVRMYECMYVCTYVCIYLFIYVVYSQHAPLPSVILHALPDHLNTVFLVTYRIYITYVWCMYVRKYVRMYVCTYVCMYVCTYVCTYVCMYLCMCVCMYVCSYIVKYLCVHVCYVCI